jgi:hypothetical protein
MKHASLRHALHYLLNFTLMFCCEQCCHLQEFTKITTHPHLQEWKKRARIRHALLNDKTLAEVRRERLNYTQLLYR